MSNTPFSWRVRDLPFVARLVIAVFLCSTGVGYFSALVQLHVQQAPGGKYLPDDNDVVMTYHGKEGISVLERLVSAPETMPFSAEGSMRAAFTTKSSWEHTIEETAAEIADKDKVDYIALDDKDKIKVKYRKQAILEIRKFREGEAEAMQSWIKTGLDKKAYDDDHYVLPENLRSHPLTERFAVRNDKGELEAVKIQSLFNRCTKCHTESNRTAAADIPLNTYERIKVYAKPDPTRGVGMSLHKLAQTTHAHLLSFSMLYLLTGILFAMTNYPAFIRFAIAPTVLVAMLVEISFWWLARLDDPCGSLFARAIIPSGGIVGACLGVQIIGTLFSLFNKVGKVIIIVLLLLALFGGWQLYVLKIQRLFG